MAIIDLRNNTIAQYKMNDNLPTQNVINEFGTDGTNQVNTDSRDTTGKINGALIFNGSSDYIDTDQSFQSTFRNSFSINCWIRPDDGQPSTNNYICGTSLSSNFYQFSVRLFTTGITATYDPGAGIIITSTPSGFVDGVETWHMLTILFEKNVGVVPSVLSLYLDGSFQNSNSSIINPDFLNSTAFFIGALSDGAIVTPGTYFSGDIDNVCLFDKVLSQDEIQFLYNHNEGTEELYGEILPTNQGEIANNNFFATIGDYDTRSTFPNNASKLLFSSVTSDMILRTANNQFNHIMVSGVPLSVSPCFYSNETSKFRTEDSRDRPNLTYFYALDVIAIDGVSHQTLTPEERTTQWNDAKLFKNRWNAKDYLNTVESVLEAVPTDTNNLFGSTLGLGQYGELLFNKTSYTIDQVDEFKEVAFMNNIVSVGRIGNEYYLIITT
jgi:hypothetical protein